MVENDLLLAYVPKRQRCWPALTVRQPSNLYLATVGTNSACLAESVYGPPALDQFPPLPRLVDKD